MASKRVSKASKAPSAGDVDAFLAELAHPRKAEILALRRIILGAHPSVGEGIKWNAPSFRTTEWFATFHLRAKEGVQLILHLGAKPREGLTVPDPSGLLEWLGKDRASVKFRDMADVDARRGPLEAVLRGWLLHV